MLGDQRLPIEPPCQCSADRLTDGFVFVKSRDVPGYMRVSTMEELRCIHRHFCSRNGEDSDLNHERNSLVSRRRPARIVIIIWEQATSILQWSFQKQSNATTPSLWFRVAKRGMSNTNGIIPPPFLWHLTDVAAVESRLQSACPSLQVSLRWCNSVVAFCFYRELLNRRLLCAAHQPGSASFNPTKAGGIKYLASHQANTLKRNRRAMTPFLPLSAMSQQALPRLQLDRTFH